MKTQAKRGHRRAGPSRVEKPLKSARLSKRGRSTKGAGPARGKAKATKAKLERLSKPKTTKVKPALSMTRAKTIGRPSGPARVLAPPTPRATVRGLTQEKQQQLYEQAARLFQAQVFDKANALFQKVTQGPNRTLAHHAQVHSRICQKRLRPPQVSLKTVDDHYNYAVTLINARRLKEAAEVLETALHMAPQADHLHYALAATQSLQGNPQAAYERLKTAIDLHPRNRILARTDADFAGILEYPPLASLLQIEPRGSLLVS